MLNPMDNTTYYVCHGPDVVHFSELSIGSSVVTGQPNCEHFDTEEEGLARAVELGYVFTIEEEPLEELEP